MPQSNLLPVTHPILCFSQFFSLGGFLGKGSEDTVKRTLILKQSLLLNTCPRVREKALWETGIRVEGSLYSASWTYKVKWLADFLFNKFPQKISFSQWGEFQGLLRGAGRI